MSSLLLSLLGHTDGEAGSPAVAFGECLQKKPLLSVLGVLLARHARLGEVEDTRDFTNAYEGGVPVSVHEANGNVLPPRAAAGA